MELRAFTLNTKTIHFYAPSFTYYRSKHYHTTPNSFPTISVTGTRCSLNCRHCGGKILETMQPATTPDKLFNVCLKLKREGAAGCLVSGGCLPDGTVPVSGFTDALRKVKRELDLTVFAHTGIIDFENAMALKQAGVDAALIDVIGSEEVIKKTLNLNMSQNDYANSLIALDKSGLPFVPHVIVGLNDGRLDGELDALKMIRAVNPSALVIIAFMPIHGTAMEKTSPPNPDAIAKVTLAARLMFPTTPLILGCMRPKGAKRVEIDVLALQAGVDAVAFPSEGAVKYAQSRSWKTTFSSSCCAQMYLDAARKTGN